MPERPTPWNGLTQTLQKLSLRLPTHDDIEEEAQLYFRRGCLAASEERYDVAMVFARKALDLSPRHLPTRLLLAQVYDRGLHEVEAAIQAYKKVISLAGYEGDNPYCAAAREALDLLVHRAARIPVEVG